MISIVTSLYKSETYLLQFIKHAYKVHTELQNNNILFEHILVANDYSEEEKKIISNSKLSFKILSVPRESFYASWNRGIRESKYDIFTSWNVDDIRFSRALIAGMKTLVVGFEATYFPFKYKRYIQLFGINVLIKSVIIDPPEFERETFTKEMHAGPFFMVHKSAFEKYGYFDESFKIAGDYEWWSRATKAGLYAVKNPALAGIFSNNGKTLSGSRDTLHQKENLQVRKSV